MARAFFNHKDIEASAQKKWADAKAFETDLSDSSKPPYYLLFEFPYPSGDLHIGHWYAYALTDIFARLKRMQGANVLFPIGFDAFGLPAENAALRNNADPKEWTFTNIERMRDQIKSMGTSLDWSKEVITCDPEYYRFTQWLFTKLFEHNLAERRKAPVKWCPKDKTVLANEQVIDGACERCGTPVEEKNLTQWFLKITGYAKRLLADLETLPWREDIKEAQRAWIGESEGAMLTFPVVSSAESDSESKSFLPDVAIRVFTTRPDTVFGATYVVLAPEHPLVGELLPIIENETDVAYYVTATKAKTERERSENKDKTGIQLEGVRAVNPATQEHIPIYVADYVLGSYGTGAVMAVPAHDERDNEFAKRFELPIRTVITSSGETSECYTGDGVLSNSGAFNGRNNREAMDDIILAVKGEKTTNYRIRDWLVSRQRYWGCPIPVVYDPEGNPHAVPAEHLPWLLPTDVSFSSGEEAPLASSNELKERVTRIFGEGWTPEYDTLDTFVDSSWYFLRYLAPHDREQFSNPSLMKKWLPVNRYSGGSEHTTMHLLYARFFQKALYDLALVPTAEPFIERFNRGIILGPDGAKMSKSKGNVVNPDEFVQKYGADAVRLYLAFIGPYNESGYYPWNLDGVASMRRFLDRSYGLLEKTTKDAKADAKLESLIAKTIQKVETDSERFKFNTAISALMILLNELEEREAVPYNTMCTFVTLLAPFAPHLAEHLTEKLEEGASAYTKPWPAVDTSLLAEEEVVVVVQIGGKRKGEVRLSKNESEEGALQAARSIPQIDSLFAEGGISKVIYVPGRILNVVPKRD